MMRIKVSPTAIGCRPPSGFVKALRLPPYSRGAASTGTRPWKRWARTGNKRVAVEGSEPPGVCEAARMCSRRHPDGPGAALCDDEAIAPATSSAVNGVAAGGGGGSARGPDRGRRGAAWGCNSLSLLMVSAEPAACVRSLSRVLHARPISFAATSSSALRALSSCCAGTPRTGGTRKLDQVSTSASLPCRKRVRRRFDRLLFGNLPSKPRPKRSLGSMKKSFHASSGGSSIERAASAWRSNLE